MAQATLFVSEAVSVPVKKHDSFSSETLPDSIINALQTATCSDNEVKLTCGDLGEDWNTLKEIMTRLGGQYVTGRKTHRFPYDPRPLIEGVARSGLLPAKNPTAFFPTPSHVIETMLHCAEVESWTEAEDFRILEPSAGSGAIADALVEMGFEPHNIDVCEALDLNCAVLEQKGYVIRAHDFLAFEPAVQYDRIVMNPPFNVGTDKLAYMTHITRAYDLLRPGGKLVAIAPPGWQHMSDKRSLAFRELMEFHGEIADELKSGTFKESGTMIATQILYLEKPHPTDEAKARDEEYESYKNYHCFLVELHIDNDPDLLERRRTLQKMLQSDAEGARTKIADFYQRVAKDIRVSSGSKPVLLDDDIDWLIAELEVPCD